MKKFLFAALLAVVFLPSCDKEAGFKGSAPVGFSVISTETRGSVVTTNSINTLGEKFLIDLFDADTKAVVALDATATCSDAVTDNQKDGKEWIMDPVVYWEDPKVGGGKRTMDAWCRYPVELNGSMGLVASTSGSSASIYEAGGDGNIVRINDDRTALSFNYMSYYEEGATSRKDASKQDDLLFACTKGSTYAQNNGRIKIEFEHALAAVYFKIGVEGDGESLEKGDNVIINSLTLQNIKRAGSCVYDPSKTDSDRFSWDTSVSDVGIYRNTGDYVQTFDQPVAVSSGQIVNTILGGGDSFEEADCFFVIPQEMTSDAALALNWTKDGVAREVRTAQIYKDKNGNVVEWKAGYKYLYTIKIKNLGASMDVELEVLPWNYEESRIEYGDVIACSDPISFDNYIAKLPGTPTQLVLGTSPIIGQFYFSSPKSATWMVTLSNSADFKVFASGDESGDGTIASGNIEDGVPAKFYISARNGRSNVDLRTKVYVAVRRSDGVTIPAPDDLQVEQYEIVLPANE